MHGDFDSDAVLAVAERESATAEFLSLVDCRPCEVKDVDPARRWIDATAEARKYQKRRADLLGDQEMPFGKHRGTLIRDVPREYLEWLVRQPSKGGYQRTERLKKQLRQWLRT